MNGIKRIYGEMLGRHLEKYRQMAFVAGPRQVGKTFICRSLINSESNYLNWDNLDDREIILKGPAAIAGRLGLHKLSSSRRVGVLDELHKFAKWKSLLKGFFDTYENDFKLLVTGSSSLDIHSRGGDSLMGRYFLYRMHPLSVAELLANDIPDSQGIIRGPKKIDEKDFAALCEHGGFPEPFINRDPAFTSRWWSLRLHQLVNEDMRSCTRVHELGQLEVMAKILELRSGCQLNYSRLASDVKVSVDTARRWVGTLGLMQFGFMLRPWRKNVSNSLRKEPKWYLRDWSGIADPGSRTETMIACHLLKAVEGWTDLGLGEFKLYYLRDKMKREVDFLVVQNGSPWFLVEAKKNEESLSPALGHFMKSTGAPYAFQSVLDMDYENADCFAVKNRPLVVPARTLLSQLI